MKTRLSPAHFFVLIALLLAAPSATAVADENAGSTTPAAATDTASTEAVPMTLTPQEIAEFEDAAGANAPDAKNASFVNETGDFISDNAPYFIIGIIVLAAILAGFLIMRGRRKSKPAKVAAAPKAAAAGATAAAAGAAGATATKAAGAPASVPSATELRRRKRAAMQRAREEERLRRRGGESAARASTGAPQGAAPAAAVNPIEAEKQAARDQASAAGAVARTGTTITPPGTGAIPAPASPSQTAPATGVVTAAEIPAAETPTAVNPLPATDGEEVVAPGPDATVGRAAAGFAAGAAGGAIAGRATSPKPVDPLEAKVAEIKAAQEGVTPTAVKSTPQPVALPEPVAHLAPEAQPAAGPAQILPDRPDPSQPAPPPIAGLSAVERQLTADSVERDRALQEAESRLREIEHRAEEAERRAAFAERLAQLKLEESERERRLDDVISGIDRAEERAREAEERAEAAERAATSALEHGSIRRGPIAPGFKSAPEQALASSSSPAAAPPTPTPKATPTSTLTPPAAPTAPPPVSGSAAAVNLNTATFEELREAELSVTQATRILAYRERFGGYSSIEDLGKVPGFPADEVEAQRGRFTV